MAVIFCWLLQTTSGLSTSPSPSVIALAQFRSRQMGARFFLEVAMLDIYYWRETPEAWEIFGWASRDQRIRPRSWGGKKKKSLKEKEENSTEIRKKCFSKWNLEEERH